MLSKLFMLFLCAKVRCFNIDTDFPVVYKDPSGNENKNYFGYSVVIYPGTLENPQKWIKIGAPRAGVSHVGTVYNCPLTNHYQGCTNMSFPIAEYSAEKAAKEVREDNWIGGTMDISYKHNRMVVCGFRRRFHQETPIKTGKLDVDYRLIGGCYWSNLNTNIFDDVLRLKDTFLDEPIINSTSGRHFYYFGQAEAGFSAHFSDTDNECIIGTPGNYDHSGGVVKIQEAFYEPPIESKRRKRAAVRFSLEISPQDYGVSNHYDLLGYSVTSGHFFGDGKLYYAAGSPKGIKTDQKMGKVFIFHFQGNRLPLIRKEIIVGEQFGAYFGSSTTTGKINKDNYDDLVIGAPFYKENVFNEGKVYVHLGGKENFIKSTVLTGTTPNGQFGSAIMFLGDLNNDGYGDVAISAPYETEFGGVVYIFRGQDSGLVEKPSQKITGKQFLPEINGFGISISRSADMDDNKYNDLAIGSSLSGHVVYLRTRPVVVISSNLQVTPNILENTEENITLRACFAFNAYEEQPIYISFNVKMDKLHQSFSEDNFILTYKGKLECKEYIVPLENSFMEEPEIYASLSYSLIEPPPSKGITIISENVLNLNDNFCTTCPILDKFRSSPNETKIKIPIKLDCGDDRICESNLVVTANITEIGPNNTFTIGSAEFLTLEIQVENKGENAYVTKLEVTLPDELQFLEETNRCKFLKDRSTAVCHVGSPLRQFAQKQQTLRVDMRSVSRYNNLTNVLITFKASTASNDTETNNFYTYPVTFKYADVIIFGWSEKKDYMLENELKDEIFNITHVYRVGKTGPTTLDKLLVTVGIPHTLITSNGDISLLRLQETYISFKGQLSKCDGDFETRKEEKAADTAEDGSSFPSSRKKGELQEENISLTDNEIDISDNTVFLNCSSDNIKCSVLQCSFDNFDDQNDFAEIRIKMEFEVAKIPNINLLDMVLISTEAEVIILSPEHFQQSGNSPDRTVILTPFKKVGPSTIALWIIILAVILGILLLILIIFGLIKMGFFRRTIREELRSLKSQQSVEEQMANPTGHDSDDHEISMEIVEDQELHPINVSQENLDLDEQTDNGHFQTNCNSSREGLIDDSEDEKS